MADYIRTFLFLMALLLAIIDWYAVITKRKRLEYLAKPGVMAFLLIFLCSKAGFSENLIWFSLGVIFSLAGDIFLMLPHEQFIPGLASFLIAHIAYIIGFITSKISLNIASLFIAVFIVMAGTRLFRRISGALRNANRQKLIPPVLIYTITISAMVFTALSTQTSDTWMVGPAFMVSGGALLFFISDGLLAWNKFVTPMKFGKISIITAYHVAQLLIALGAVSQFYPLG